MERKFLNIGLSLALGAILLLGGCARKTGDRTQIHFTAPPLTYAGKAGAQAASLNVVFVNGTVASNPNVKPLRYQWDSHSCQPGAACSPAASLSWEVPNGSTPLIQILAVYEDESNGHMKFMYADQEKAVSGAIANVNLKLVEAGDSNLQGHIYGRYLDGSAMGGPTGAMIGKFHPPGGRAPMELFNDPMIAGWFSAMVMEAGANFSYTVNGRAIFPEINISSALLGTSAHMLRVAVPAYKRDNGGGALELEGAQKLFLGYFGSVPAGKKACYDSSSNPIADTAQASGSLAPIVWQSPPAAGQAGVEAGGEGISVAGSGHTCHNDANAFKDFLFFHQAELRNGRDSVSGMRPPFRSFDVGGYRTYASTTHDAGANTLTIDYKLLPDASGAVNGMTVFMRARPPNDHDIYGMGEGIACTTVNSKYQSMGFAFGGDFPIVHPASDGQAVVGNIISPVNTQFVLCPYSNASGAKTYFDAGIEAYSFGAMGPINQLSLRLAGTQPMQSNARGPSLPSAGVRLLKSAVMNGYHAILVKAGEMYVESTFLEKAEVSVDGGVNWTQVAVQGNSYMGFTGPIAALPITSSGGQDALFNVLDAAPNSVIFKIRVKLTPAGKTRYGVASDTVIGPAIQLAAADICSSATLQLVDESDVLISPSSLFSPFTGTGGTDLERTFSLAWNGCSLPTYAPIDYIGFSSVDNSCFDQSDIQPVASNPMQFKISPTDKYGADCYIGGSISFVQPSSGGTPNKVEVFTSSVELRHSSAPAKVKVLALAVDPFTSITGELWHHFLVTMGPGSQFKGRTIFVNSDGKAVDSTAATTGATTYSTPAQLASNIAVISPSGSSLLIEGLSTIVATPILKIAATDSGKTGSLFVNFLAPAKNVLDVSENALGGGSPLLLVAGTSQLELLYYPSNMGDFSNKTPMTAAIPGPFGTTAAYARVHVINGDMTNMPAVLVSARYGQNSKFAYGRVTSFSPLTIDWAPVSELSNLAVFDVRIDYTPMAVPTAFLHETPGNSARIVRFVLPLKTSSWSAFTVDATLTISDMETPISFATCGADTFAVGRTSSNEFKAVRFPAPSEALSFDRILDVGASDVSGATSASCVVTHPHKAESPRVFVLNNPAAANSIYAFDGADSDCGSGTSYAALGGSSNLGQGTDLRAVLGVQNGPGGAQGFLAVHTDGTHPSVATFVPVTCATTLLTTNSPTTVGSFGLPDGDIRGAKFVDSPSYSMGMMSAKPGFAIFGANGNFNWLESR